MSEHVDVAVVGAGVTGLAAAWAAERHGATVAVLEAESECGGAIKSQVVNGFLVERGATSMAGSAQLMTAFRELSLRQDVVVPPKTARRRFIVRNGQLHALPSSPPECVTTSALSVRGKLRALLEPWVRRSLVPPEAESVAALVRRRFGADILDYVIDPFVSGVYAGDPELLSSRFALRQLSELEQQYGSVAAGVLKRSGANARARRTERAALRNTASPVHDQALVTSPGDDDPAPHILTFRNGMQQLPRAIERQLTQPVRYQERVTRVLLSEGRWRITSRASHNASSHAWDGREITAGALIVALPAHQLHAVSWPHEIKRRLGAPCSIVHAPVATVALGFAREQVAHPLNGFGLLVPHREQREMLGVLFNSTMFMGRAPQGHVLLTCFVGGARSGMPVSAEEAEHQALREVTRLLGISGAPVLASAHRWGGGIPQFNLGHEAVGNALGSLESEWPSLFFSGSYRSGVAVGECLTAGLAVGARAAAAGRSASAVDYDILAAAGPHSL